MAGMFDKFLSKLTETLGGGPSSEGFGGLASEVAANKASGQATKANPIDLNADYVAQNAPATNVIDFNAIAAKDIPVQGPPLWAADHIGEDPNSPERLQAFFAPRPQAPQPTPAELAGLPAPNPVEAPPPALSDVGLESAPTMASIPEPGAKKGSRAKHGADVGTKITATQGVGGPTAASPTPASDSIADLLKSNADKYGREQNDALKAAADSQNLTQEEKIATALLAALPGLAGLIGGAAISGGQGAMAGLAGGLTGGAQGIQGIAANKKEQRKELLAKAEKAGDRLGRVDDQKLAHAEQLQQQGFTSGMKDKDYAHDDQSLDKRLKFEGAQGNANRYNARLLKEMDVLGDLKKAQLTGGAKGGKLTEQQERTATLLPTMLQSNNVAKQMEAKLSQIPQTSGASNMWNKLVPQSMESDAYKAYDNAAMGYTGSYLFKVSGAAVPPDEIKRYSKILFAQPGDNEQQVKQKQGMRDSIDAVMKGTLDGSREQVQAALEQAGIPPALIHVVPGVSPEATTSVWSSMKRVQ